MVGNRMLSLAAASFASLFVMETNANAQLGAVPQVPVQATVVPGLPPAQPVLADTSVGGYSPSVPEIPQGDYGYSPSGYSSGGYSPSGCYTGGCTPEVYMHGRLRGKWESWKARQQYKWWGYPEEFEEVPFGCTTNSIFNKQISKGQLTRLALYDYDFINGTAKLNYRGRCRVADLIPMLQSGIGPLVVEEIPERNELNAERRVSVLNEIHNLWSDFPGDMVVVGRPRAAGLSGVEARVINNNLMDNTSSRGVSAQQFSAGDFSPSGEFTVGGAD